MAYTVKQLSDLAGVSVRTLHYYDEIGLLPPDRVGANGYRYYEEESLFRLQQILFYRELDLSLEDIGAIINRPGFDPVAALQAHRAALAAKIGRLRGLIHTVDSTITYLMGAQAMSDKKQLFAGFSEEEERAYTQEARDRWGEDEVNASTKRWQNYSQAQQQRIMAEGQAIYADLAAVMNNDDTAASPAAQHLIGRWHQHMRYFYEPSLERLRGLGQLYVDDARFGDKMRALHPDLPEFMQQAINHYCDDLDADGAA